MFCVTSGIGDAKHSLSGGSVVIVSSWWWSDRNLQVVFQLSKRQYQVMHVWGFMNIAPQSGFSLLLVVLNPRSPELPVPSQNAGPDSG